jgi:hypothetical protein
VRRPRRAKELGGNSVTGRDNCDCRLPIGGITVAEPGVGNPPGDDSGAFAVAREISSSWLPSSAPQRHLCESLAGLMYRRIKAAPIQAGSGTLRGAIGNVGRSWGP